ncbi:hypothetical protein [Micromonospora sp. URMC 103]|uniref:hypothetical protein n=1 Tax=Micromonospora sp. URMC 103 TaxID=3423406 RepID=UPI003F1CB113
MNTHCFVGTTNPTNPHLVHARFVLFDAHPQVVVPTLAHIWAHHARYDARALTDAILACDWAYLDPAVTVTTGCRSAGQRPVPGVGMALPGNGAAEPVTMFPLCQAGHLDAQWIYLIDPVTATVAVHTDDGQRTACYPLPACATSSRDAFTGQADGGHAASTVPQVLVCGRGAPR